MRLNAKELAWFKIANSGHPSGFYPFKDRFLRRFAERDGYDLQHVEQFCWTCEGSGEYVKGELCRKCDGSGVYRTVEVWLERWNLCGTIYHKPVDPIPHWQREGQVRGEIQGRIQHAPVSDLAARRSFYRLLLRFEPVNFYDQVCADVKARALHYRAVWAWRLMRLRDKLDLFPAVEKSDEIPF